MPQLRTYIVQAPDGKTITMQGPEGAPQDEVIRRAQSMYAQQYGSGVASKPKLLSTPPVHGFGGSGTYTREMSPSQLEGELDLQRLEGIGFDPSSPIIGTGKNIIGGITGLLEPLFRHTESPSDALDFAKNIGNAALSIPKAFTDMIGGTISGVTGGPDDEGFQRAARGSGQAAAMLSPPLLNAARTTVPGSIMRGPIRQAMPGNAVRLGRSLPDLPPPAQPIRVPVGKRLPSILKEGALIEYHPPVQLLSESIGGRGFLETINEALPDLKHAQMTTIRSAMDSQPKLELAASSARNRVWNESIAPAIQGKVDLTSVANQLIRGIPKSVRLETKKYVKLVRNINSKYRGKSVSASTLHEIAKEARAGLRSVLARDNFDRAAALEKPAGKFASAENDALRNTLYEHVNRTTGVDIRPAMQKYGALSDFDQTIRKVPDTPTMYERIFGTEAQRIASPQSVKSGVMRALTSHWTSDIAKVRRAFDGYILEPDKVTPRFEATYIPPSRQIGASAGGARPMPMPETSSVVGELVPPEPGTRATRTGRLLTTGTPIMPPLASDIPSAIQNSLGVESASRYPGNVGYPGSMELPMPAKPRLGDRFMQRGQMYTYSKKGWIPSRNPQPTRPIGKLNEP